MSHIFSRRSALAGGLIGTTALIGGRSCLAPSSSGTKADLGRILPTKCSTTIEPGLPTISDFLGRGFDRERDDARHALSAAAAWSSKNSATVVVDGTLRLGSAARIDADGASLLFDCASLLVRDDGQRVNTRYGQPIPIGLYVVGNDISLLGNCALLGDGEPGKTFLHGLYAEEVSNLTIEHFTLANMAIGLHFMCCDEVRCGDTMAHWMWGLQGNPDDPIGAGSAQVVSGCRRSRFGKLTSYNNDKPARYLSVGKLATGETRNNVANEYGLARVSARSGSPWAQVTAVRSSVNSTFAGGIGSSMNYLLNLQMYETDGAYKIDGNDFGDWAGTVRNSPDSSVDAALQFWSHHRISGVGFNRLGNVSARMARLQPNYIQKYGWSLPQTFGLWSNTGNWEIASLSFNGFTFGIEATDCDLKIGSLQLADNEYVGARFGKGTVADIERLELSSPLPSYASGQPHLRSVDKGESASPPRIFVKRVIRSGNSKRQNPILAGSENERKNFRIGRIVRK